MRCTRLAGNTGRKKSTKIRHLRTITQLCRAVSLQLGLRQLKHQYRLHMSLQYGELQPLTVEIDLPVWGTPVNFNGFRVLAALLQRHRSQEANETLHYVWPSPGLLHCIYIFGGSFCLREFCPVQNSLYVQVLCSALLHGTRAACVSQTLRCGTRNGITELSQRAPPIFGRAAITLGIGTHSSCYCENDKFSWQ